MWINVYAQSGRVFQDSNGNGSRQAGETGIPGISVKCTDTSGTTQTVTTNSTGQYSLTSCSGAVRLEFTIPASGCNVSSDLDFQGFSGTDNKTSVQFVNSTDTNVDFGVYDPAAFVTQSNPTMFVPRFCNGNMSAGTQSGNTGVLASFPYLENGLPASDGGTAADPVYLAYGSSIGSVWGTAYSRQSKKLFVSAFLKRHVGLGAAGPGGIYMLDPATPTPAGTTPTNMSLDALGIATQGSGAYTATAVGFHAVIGTNAQRGLTTGGALPSHDPSAYGQVGKVSLGDLDISTDGRYLFTTNLYDRKVYRIDLTNPDNPTFPTTAAGIKSYTALPWLSGGFSCDQGVARPFGLKYYREKLFIGVVCTGENQTVPNNVIAFADKVRAYVFEVDPTGTGSGSIAIQFPLNYDKETPGNGDGADHDGWYAWSDDHNIASTNGYLGPTVLGFNQPILSDIEFDADGSMILALMDRAGHQWGVNNYSPTATDAAGYVKVISGDILRTWKNPTTCQYELEANGAVGPFTSTAQAPLFNNGVWSGTGPGTPNGTGAAFTSYSGQGKEFYWGDFANILGNNYPTPHHNEGIIGGLAIFGSSGEVIATGMDPVNDVPWSAGTYRLSNTTGERPTGTGYNLYSGADPGSLGGFLGKANGLGDIEITTEVPPLEIGNRVWLDTDNDGIQDPSEVGISGVQVELIKSGSVIETATTNAQGIYYFTSKTGTSTANKRFGVTQLVPNMAYTLRFPTTATVSGTTYNLTTAAAGSNRLIDSNAPASGDVTILATDIPVAGANNHSFDVGYTVAACSLSVTATPGACVSATNTYSVTGQFTFTSAPTSGTLSATIGASSSTPITMTGTTTSPQSYTITGLTADGASHTVSASFSASPTCSATVNYTAPNSCTITGQPDLQLTKTSSVSSVTSGQTFSYTITLTNNGTLAATGVQVRDLLPASLTYVSSTASQGSYSNSTGIWTVGTVAVGATLTLTITVTAN